MPRLSRRHLLGGLALLPARARAAAEPITVVCPNVSDIVALDMLNAKAAGHFAAQGLDVTLVGSGTGVGAMQQLVGGRCQFLRGAGMDLIKATAKQSVPVLSIGDPEHKPSFVLLSSPDRPIRDAAMLRGRRVGVFTLGSTTDNYLDLMLHRAGVPYDTVERQAVGSNPNAFALVRAGRLDAMLLPYEPAWPLIHPPPGAPDPAAVVLPVSASVTMPGRCYLTTRAIVAQRPELALAFMRAMAASVLEIVNGPAEQVVARCAAAFDMPGLGPMAQSVAIVRWMAENWLAQGRAALLRNDPAAWQAGVATMAAAGFGSVPDGTEFHTNRFVDQALPS